MSLFLVLIPALLAISSILIYRFIGKREFLRFDLVQFLYAFVLMPLMFVWGKIMIYILFKTAFNGSYTGVNYFIIDAVYGIIFLYIFGFEMLHSLTKSVSLKVQENPLYDVFGHLEYFHLWLTHLVFFAGSLLLLAIFSIANLSFPLALELPRYLLYLLVGSGLISGILMFIAILLSDPRQGSKYRFMRTMKIGIGILFILQVFSYLIFSPPLAAPYLVYWWVAMVSTSMVFCAFLSYRSTRTQTWFIRLIDRLRHPGLDFGPHAKEVRHMLHTVEE